MYGNSLIADGSLSLRHYAGVFSDTRQIGLFCKSLSLASGVALLSLIIGVPLAFLLARTDVLGKKLWQWLYLVPLIIPPYIHAIAWISLLGEQGMFNRFIMDLFSLKEPLFNLYGIQGAIMIMALSYYPFVTLLTLSGLNAMDKRLEDAASLNYGPLKVFRGVTLPLLSPYILSGGVFVFIFSLFNYGVPALLRVHTYPVEIFAHFSAFYNQGAATASSLPLILVALMLLLGQRYYMGTRSYVTIDTGRKGISIITLNRWRKPAFLFTFLVISFSVLLPISVLMVQSGSWESFRVAFRTSSAEIITTLSLALIAATLILLLAYLLTDSIEDKRFKNRNVLDVVTFIPFAVPATVLGIGLIVFWNRPLTEAVYGSATIVIIAYIARFLPFSVRALTSNLKQVSPGMKEAAVLTERRWWRRVVKVELPLSTQGLVAGWVIAFILCIGELGSTLLVIPPGKGTAALKIYTLMHYGANQLVAALSLILVGITLAVSSGVILVAGRRWHEWGRRI
jgi:iron(III) transport system permease protein